MCPKVADGLYLKTEAKKLQKKLIFLPLYLVSWLSVSGAPSSSSAWEMWTLSPKFGGCYHSYLYHNLELENLLVMSVLQHRRCFASCRNLILVSKVRWPLERDGMDVTVAVSVEQGDMFWAVCCESDGDKPRKGAFPSSYVSLKMCSISGELAACLWTLGMLPSCCLPALGEG